MERNYFEKVDRNKTTSKTDSKTSLTLKYWKRSKGCHENDHKNTPNKLVESASIFHPLKLYRKGALKWRQLFVYQKYIQNPCQNEVEICRYQFNYATCFARWVYMKNKTVGIKLCQPKISIVTTSNSDVVLKGQNETVLTLKYDYFFNVIMITIS